MPNKWICSAIWCGLTGVLIALGYLLLVASHPSLSDVSNAPPNWLIGLFCSMLLLSVLLNLIAFFGLELSSKPLRRWWRKQYSERQLDDFFQTYANDLRQLGPTADLFIWSRGHESTVIKLLLTPSNKQVDTDRTTVAGLPTQLAQMRQLLQLKLQYQCQQAYWLSAEPADFITRIYARESGIHCLLFRDFNQIARAQ